MLAILGSGPLEDETRALVGELRLDDAVLLPGRVETRDWLERADMFVHTSRWEGFGIVLLEAMLAGLAVVATRVSAVPEIVDDGGTGVLVDPGDVTAALGRPLRPPRSSGSRQGARARGQRAGSHVVLGRQDGRRHDAGLRRCVASRPPGVTDPRPPITPITVCSDPTDVVADGPSPRAVE